MREPASGLRPGRPGRVLVLHDDLRDLLAPALHPLDIAVDTTERFERLDESFDQLENFLGGDRG